MPTKDPIKRAAQQRRYYHRNPDKARARKAAWRAKNPEKRRIQDQKYRAKHREELNARERAKRALRPKKGKAARQLSFPSSMLFPEVWKRRQRELQVLRSYKITLEEFEAKKAEQWNRCATCRRSFDEVRAVADHNRKTGKFRAVLCDSCNLAIGHAYEKPGTLRALASYIQTA